MIAAESTIQVGTVVSYEDMANPLRTARVVEVISNMRVPQFRVRFANGTETVSDLRQHGWNVVA